MLSASSALLKAPACSVVMPVGGDDCSTTGALPSAPGATLGGGGAITVGSLGAGRAAGAASFA